MSWLLKLLAGRWIAVAVGAAFLGLLAIVGIQHKTIQSKSEQIGEARAGEAAARQAAADNHDAALDLAERLRAEVKRQQMDRKAQEAATAALNKRIEALNRTVEAERQARDDIYFTDQECALWRSQPVCDLIADRLRGSGSGGGDG